MRIKTVFQRKTISGRLILFSTIFVAAAVLVASVVLCLIVAGVVREQIDQRLDTQIEGLRSALVSAPDGKVSLTTQLNGPPFDRPGSGWYWQVTGQAEPLTSRSLAGGTISAPGQPFDWRQLLGGGPQPGRSADHDGQALYLRTAQVAVGNQLVEISVSAPQSALTSPATRSLLWLIPAMLLLGVGLLVGTFWQVRYGLRPLRQLTADVGDVVAGKRSSLHESDIEELQPVTSEVNRLIEQNARRLIDTRIHFANMAHGLKTPVTSLMLALGDVNDPDGSMRQLVERIDRRIRHHMNDARRAAAGETGRSSTSLKPHIDDLVLALERIYADKPVSVVCEVDPRLAVGCDAEDVDEIIGNILDNAFKWCAGHVKITAEQHQQTVTIRVADDGPGFSDDNDIAQAFKPGSRLDNTVPGHGFGLSIAKEISELYGGAIAISNGRAGLQVAIDLPAGNAGR